VAATPAAATRAVAAATPVVAAATPVVAATPVAVITTAAEELPLSITPTSRPLNQRRTFLVCI
jgi:hypothetical protein